VAHTQAKHISRVETLHCNGKNRLGIPIVVTTSTVATSILATIGSNPTPGWKIAAGLLSLLAAVLSIQKTFFKLAEVAERRQSAGASYGTVRRGLDIFILRVPDADDTDRRSALWVLERISSRLSELTSESPTIPDGAFQQAIEEIEEERDKLPTSAARLGDGA
jgi:hypothetical protein